VLTQVVRESTIANTGKTGDEGVDARQVARQSEIAWNLCTAVFYKVGGRPWKVASIRNGVCYVGLVFKKDDTGGSVKNACCAAQMFLDSGDGMVFKGAVGHRAARYRLADEAELQHVHLRGRHADNPQIRERGWRDTYGRANRWCSSAPV
jgi:hypothetical protein